MGLFKNEVDSIPDDLLKRRRILKVVVFLLICLIAFGVFYFVNKNKSNNSTDNKTTIPEKKIK